MDKTHFLSTCLNSLLILFAFLIFAVCRKGGADVQHETTLKDGWYIGSAEEVGKTGDIISRPDFDVKGWYSADVPSTVLAALIKNDVYQNPFFGKNLEDIPTGQFKHAWWYRKEFKLPYSAVNVRLIFEGINYRANVWLNGHQIASSDSLFGSFRIFDLDITTLIDRKSNILAVEIFPPQPGDPTIGFVDWNPQPPDANMGIWREVKLRTTGSVSLENPFVQSKVNLETLDQASLTISADLTNRSDQRASGVVNGEFENIKFSQSYSLAPHERKQIAFSPAQFDNLNIKNPRLWWPNNLGEPNLYLLNLNVTVDNEISNVRSLRFGIRDVTDYINENGYRGYKINGKNILIRGGGWVDDIFLADTDRKIEDQIKYTKFMNLNTIRLEGFWGNSHKLYDLADQYGILIMAGWSCQWEWDGYLGGPTDEFGGIKTAEQIQLVTDYLNDQVLWLRNHPSIFLWVLGSDKLPRPELEKKYYKLLAYIDSSRPTLASCGYAVSEVSGPSAVKMNGPYDYVTPNYWYLDEKRGGAFGFNTETGPGPQPTPLESIKKTIPEDHLWPIDEFWNYHCGRNEFNTLRRYNNALDHRYGAPNSLEEYIQKAQITNYEAIRAMFEAFSVNKYYTTGIIQWMLNAAWPKLYWQLFDYYLMPNGAFYGTKTANKPMHIIYNYGDADIYIINDGFSPLQNLKVEVNVLNIDSRVVFSKNLQVSIDENTSKKILTMPEISELSPVYFIDLKLKDDNGKKISENFYWLSVKQDVLDEEGSTWFVTPNKEFADYSALKDLPEIEVNADYEFEDLGNEQQIRVVLKNQSDTIAFFIELNVYEKESGNSILPIFWDDNYVSLLPGESKEICGRFSKHDVKNKQPGFKLSGWNVKNH